MMEEKVSFITVKNSLGISLNRFQMQALVYGVLALVVTLMEFTGLGLQLRNVSAPVVSVPLAMISRVVTAVEFPFSAITTGFGSAQQIRDLEVKYSQAQAEINRLEFLESENRALRQLLDSADRPLRETVVSQPIISFSRPAIAGGTEEDLFVGAPVVIGNTLVGRVSAVQRHTSEVELLFQSSVPVVAQTANGVEGVLVGNGRQLLLTEVRRDAEITIGDRISTTGQEGVPPGLFVGQVVRIDQDPAAPIKEVEVEQLVDFYQARVVEVLL